MFKLVPIVDLDAMARREVTSGFAVLAAIRPTALCQRGSFVLDRPRLRSGYNKRAWVLNSFCSRWTFQPADR